MPLSEATVLCQDNEGERNSDLPVQTGVHGMLTISTKSFAIAIVVIALAWPSICRSSDCPQFQSSEWDDLIRFRPPSELQSDLETKGWHPQFIEDASSDEVNLDYYSVEILKAPTVGGSVVNGEALLELIRKRLSFFVDHSLGSFSPGDLGDKADWEAGKLGSRVVFNMFVDTLPRITRSAQVVLTRRSSNSWTLSTGWRFLPWHPVSGTREFGIKKLPDGNFAFYTRGADRISNIIDNHFQGMVFEGGSSFWTGVMDRVVDFAQSHGGQASELPTIIQRPCWNDVKANLGRNAPVGGHSAKIPQIRTQTLDDGTVVIIEKPGPIDGEQISSTKMSNATMSPDGDTFAGLFTLDGSEITGDWSYRNGEAFAGRRDKFGAYQTGTYEWLNGSQFSGKFDSDYPSEGEWQIEADGKQFTGMFVNGAASDGTWTFADGSSYKGTSENGEKLVGTYKWADGKVFTGKFVNDSPSDGHSSLPDGTDFTGTIAGDGTALHGTYKWPGGDLFVGSFRDGKPLNGIYTPHGKNSFQVSNGGPVPSPSQPASSASGSGSRVVSAVGTLGLAIGFSLLGGGGNPHSTTTLKLNDAKSGNP